MTKKAIQYVAGGSRKPVKRLTRHGQQKRANIQLNSELGNSPEFPVELPRNRRDRRCRTRGNITSQYFDDCMQSHLKKTRQIYYHNSNGTEMNYPINSNVRKLTVLKILKKLSERKQVQCSCWL